MHLLISFYVLDQLETSNQMEHYMEQTQDLRSYSTDMSFSQQDHLLSFQPGIEIGLLYSEPNGNQVDDAGASREVPSGRKRRDHIPTQTPQEKRMKKNEADRRYRKNHKDEFNKLREIASWFGGVEKMEHQIKEMVSEFHRLEQMKYKFGGIEEMESKLHSFDQITSMFGEIDEIVPEINRLKNIESQHIKYEQMKYKFGGIEEMESKLHRFDQITSIFGKIDEMVPQKNRLKNMEFQDIKYEHMESCLNHQNAQQFFDFLQQEDYNGMQSVNFNNQVQGPTIDLLEDYEISEMFPAAESGTMPDLVCSDAHVTEFIDKHDENVMSYMCLSGFNDLHGECQTVGEFTFTQSLVSSVNDIFNDHSNVTRNGQSSEEKRIADLMAELKFLIGEHENEVNATNAKNKELAFQMCNMCQGYEEDDFLRTVGLL